MRWPRSGVIVLVLVLMLAVAAVLAYHAQQAARSHRTTAENVLRDYARFASWEFSQHARRDLNSVFGTQLARLAAACAGRDTLPDPAAWRQAGDG
jgi:Tfp pilus assembly protein PilE